MEELAEMGASVYTCSRKEEELNQRLQEWGSRGFKVSGSVCDASSADQRLLLSQKVSSAFDGKLNILVSAQLCCFNVKFNVHMPRYLIV